MRSALPMARASAASVEIAATAQGSARPYVSPSGQRFLNRNAGVADVAQSLPGVFVEATANKSLNAGGCCGGQRIPVGLLHDHSSQRVGDVLTCEGLVGAQHLEKHGAE
jgi:hypothetical protein